MPLLAALRLPRIRPPHPRQNVVTLTLVRTSPVRLAAVTVTVLNRMATIPALVVSRIAVTMIGAALSAGYRSPR